LDILREKAKKKIFTRLWRGKHKYFKPRPDIQQLTRPLLQIYVTIFGQFKGKSQKKIILEGFGEEKHKYFKLRPDIQQLTRLLLG
jgi:hypothetical protein